MSQLVDPADIERIVGAHRDPVVHIARAVSGEKPEDRQVYVLHSQACLDLARAGTRDLRECPFSLALDRGINLGLWAAYQDAPMRAAVTLGDLVPWHPWMECPTCTGTVRETEGMVCQTCGTDYGTPFEIVPYSADAPRPVARARTVRGLGWTKSLTSGGRPVVHRHGPVHERDLTPQEKVDALTNGLTDGLNDAARSAAKLLAWTTPCGQATTVLAVVTAYSALSSWPQIHRSQGRGVRLMLHQAAAIGARPCGHCWRGGAPW